MSRKSLGYWTLPKPDIESKEWLRVPRVARTIPFGYKEDPEDSDFLLPIKEELDALEQAKKHLQQYSYREVAIWLSKETSRYISHMGLKKRIDIVNKLYDEGHTIVYWTARGTTTGIDWTDVTRNQLDNWGCQWNELICGKDKGAFDMVIDDKAYRIDEI